MDSEAELNDAIEYYERLIKSKLKMLEDEEINLLLSERDEIHDLFSSLPDNRKTFYMERICLLDKEMISQIDSISVKEFGYEEYPRELWWWHLDKLDDLTEKERSTL